MYTYDRRIASRLSQPKLSALLERAAEIHTQYGAWIKRFPGVLRAAVDEADDLKDKADMPLVWQDRFVSYWREMFGLEKELADIAYDAEGFDYPRGPSGRVPAAYEALQRKIERAFHEISVPVKARHRYPTDKIHFEFSTKLNRKDHIAYEVPRLQEWADAFEGWTNETKRSLQSLAKTTR